MDRKALALFWFWVAFFMSLQLVESRIGVGSSPDYWYSNCSNGNFTPGGIFEMNLKSAASRLPESVSSAPQFFINEAIGSQKEQVYVVASCRTDWNATLCKICVSEALQEAPVVCPFKRGVIVLYEACTLAYSDKEFMFSMNNSSDGSLSFFQYNNSQAAAIQSDVIRGEAASLISDVIDKAAELSPAHSATGRKDLDAEGHKVYALAECVPTLGSSTCKHCLQLLDSEQIYSSEAAGGRITNLWCQLRWELYSFFTGAPLVDLPADHQAKTTKHHHNYTWAIVGGAVAGVVVIAAAIVALLWWGNKLPSRRQRSSGKRKSDVEETSEASLSSKEGCPSALGLFEEVINLAQGRRIALFLDYDGTLSPIVNNPDRAFMSEEMRTTVRKAATLFTTSIVSGRAREKVMDFVKITEINYAGSHGLDIMTTMTAESTSSSDITEVPCLYEPAKDFLSKVNEVRDFLVSATDGIIGATVENNKYCLSVHYRNVADEDKLHVKKVAHDASEKYSFKLTKGQMVYELRPPLDWNKGHAVGYLLKNLGLDNPETFSIYIGDDTTDEDAFQVLREQCKGIGILVAERSKPTAASYSVKNPNEVKAFLDKMVEWGER